MYRNACLGLICVCIALPACAPTAPQSSSEEPAEVVFWHFWGGRDRPVVDRVIERFNESQSDYRVRGVAMPGANLDLKFFLSVTGGDPPDLLNHDDPIVADWAHRGALTPLDELAPGEEIRRLETWLYPAARSLGSYDGHLYALANGLDVRALYYNKTWFEELRLGPPKRLDDFDRLNELVAPAGRGTLERVGFLPDPRRLWAWGPVFGGRFADLRANSLDEKITADSPELLAALEWMASYSSRYGADRIATFRTGDQALTGATFPLLADRRYAAIMDGQWRLRDISEAAEAASKRGEEADEYRVAALPPPEGGQQDAGWVNGNLFIVPRGAKNPRGAWEFMKFWSGFDGNEAEAAVTASRGGWIPVSEKVVDQPAFQSHLQREPRLRTFIDLAASENQLPTPALPVASFYYREVIAAAEDVMYRGDNPQVRLSRCADRVRSRLRTVMEAP